MANKAIVGEKVGMTQVWDEDNSVIPVTVLRIRPNRVVRVKTTERDGYSALQVTFGEKDEQKLTRPEAGHFASNGVDAGVKLVELRLDDVDGYEVGQELTVETLSENLRVDVTSVSKGKGFAGTVKRWNFKMQDATHGNSISHRAPGSIGQCQTPGKVWKGKKMSGHMGNVQKTVQSLKIVDMDVENNVIYIKGSVPGFNGSELKIKPSIKAS